MTLQSKKFLAIAAVLALAATGCASTSKKNVGQGGNGLAPPVEGTTGPAGAPSVAVSSGSANPSAPAGSATGARGGAVTPTKEPSFSTGAPRPTVRTRLPGISAKTIKVGYWFLASQGACAGVGVVQSDPGQPAQCGTDDEKEANAAMKWINAHGGMAGRKMELHFFHTDLETGGTYAIQAEQACTHFTQDVKVAFVVSEGQVGRPYMGQCLSKAKIPFVEPSWYPFDETLQRQFAPFMYQPNRARPERWVRGYIDGLHAQGFFAKGTRVGLFRFNGPPHKRVTEAVLKPRLARYGITLTREAVITQPSTFSGYGQENSEISSQILAFKRLNINRVIFFSGIGELEIFFLPQAEAQDYHPVLGLNSGSWPQFIGGSQTTPNPSVQFRGAMGVGWSPSYDVNPAQDPGGGQPTADCKKAMQQGGLGAGAGRNNKCDQFFFVQALFNRARSLTVEGLRNAANSIGGSFATSASFSTFFGPGHYDGPSAYRFFYWDGGCSCFKYRGGNHPMP